MYHPRYLFMYVQRLVSPPGNHPGLHADYMGMSEFDFDAPLSRKRMNDAALTIAQRTISYCGRERSVFFLTEPNTLDEKLVDFELWVKHGMRTNEGESSYFEFGFSDFPLPGFAPEVLAWWSIYDDLVWAFSLENIERFTPEVSRGAFG